MSAATRAINYGRVMQIMGMISAAGFDKVSLITEPTQSGATPRSTEPNERAETTLSAMPERSGYIASGILHLGLVLLFMLGLPNFFRHRLPEETPLVVQLVKIGPETRATQLTKTPPTREAKPEVAEAVPPPKPVPPAPDPAESRAEARAAADW